jgi:Swi5
LVSDVSNSREDPEKIVEKHIKLLHDYNESKDAAQVLLGTSPPQKDTYAHRRR